MAAPERASLQQAVEQRLAQLRRLMRGRLQQAQQRLDYGQRALASPRAPLQALAGRVHALALRAGHALSRRVGELRRAADGLAARIRHAAPRIDASGHLLQRRGAALSAAMRHLLHERQRRLQTLAARLQSLDPHAVLARGYALATDAEGHVVADAARLAAGDLLRLRFARGSASTRVVHTEPAPDDGAPTRGAG